MRTRNTRRPSRFRSRFAADDDEKQDEKKSKKKGGKETPQPGQLSSPLRRRMGDALADIFDEFGPDIVATSILALKDSILEKFKEGFESLDQTVKGELGRRGAEEARQHIRAWASEIVEHINQEGLEEVATAVEDFVGTLTSEFVQEDEEDELLEVEDFDIEPVEEVQEEEVVPEEDTSGDEEVALETTDLGDLGLELPAAPGEEAAASFGPHGGRRQRPARRRFQREGKARRLFDRTARRPYESDEYEDYQGTYFVLTEDMEWDQYNELSPEEHEAYCDQANAWLESNEPDEIEITFRPVRHGELAGIYRRSANGNMQILGYSVELPETVRSLVIAAWESATSPGGEVGRPVHAHRCRDC